MHPAGPDQLASRLLQLAPVNPDVYTELLEILHLKLPGLLHIVRVELSILDIVPRLPNGVPAHQAVHGLLENVRTGLWTNSE